MGVKALDVLGRMADVAQLALGAGVLRPAFRALRRARPEVFARMRHEPFAARGEAFVREVGALEKAAFVAKMLGTDGDYTRGAARIRDDAEAPADEMLFAGDILFPGALPGTLGTSSLSPALRARIARSACFVVNLEGTLAAKGHELAPLMTVRGVRQLLAYERDPKNADWASRLDVEGFRALVSDAPRALASVANNHTLDDGMVGFDRTIAALRDMNVGVVGDARRDEGGVIVDVGAHRVGLFAIAYGSNQLGVGEGAHLCFDEVPYRLDRGRIASLTDRLRARGATHIVALLHWGHEHEHRPSKEQRAVVAQLFEAGAAAVIGHHPHIVQASEAARGKWVSYSLGDFVGGDRTIWSRFGTIVSLAFEPGGRVRGQVIPVVQTPFWAPHQTMLLRESKALERAVFDRYFTTKLPISGGL